MIKPIDPIYRMYYNTYKPPEQKKLVDEVKKVEKNLKSTGQLIDIKV